LKEGPGILRKREDKMHQWRGGVGLREGPKLNKEKRGVKQKKNLSSFLKKFEIRKKNQNAHAVQVPSKFRRRTTRRVAVGKKP